MDRSNDFQATHDDDDEVPSEKDRVARVDTLGAAEVVERILAAQAGSSAALGELFQNCRNYLLLIAKLAINPGLQAKVGASDVVQETFFEAQRIFDRFEGVTEDELLRWLKQILEYKIANTRKRHYGTVRRDLVREVDWYQLFGSGIIPGLSTPTENSPSAICRTKEDQERYHHAFALLPRDQQDVIGLRVDEDLSFEEVGLRMDRTAEAARKLFARALNRLQSLVGKNA